MSSQARIESLLESLGAELPIPHFPSADIIHRPIDIYKAYLADTASKLLDVSHELAWEAVQVVPAANPKDNSDLDLVVPKLKLKSNKPKELAQEASFKFTSSPLFQRPIADGIHLCFFFSSSTLPQLVLHYVNSQWKSYGCNAACGQKDPNLLESRPAKVVIDFSRPKLASEFNSAHLRSTLIGAQIANLHQSMGWDVVRLNYLGDWGKDLGLLAVGWGRFGSEKSFQNDPMGHILEVYDKINELFKPEKDASKAARDEGRDTAEIEIQGLFAERDAFFKRMEDGDAEAVALWKRIRDVSVDYYTKAYARLNVKFDEFSGEPQVSSESIEEVESVLKEKGFYEEREGSWIIDYNKHGHKLGVAVVRGRTGSTSYILRDIAAVLDRVKKHAFDKMIYVIDGSQDSHFSKMFQALRYMGRDDIAEKLEHINFGKVSGMSTQLGKAHLLGDIVDQAVNAAKEALATEKEVAVKIEDLDASAAILGATGLIAQDALYKRTSSYTFNSETLASFESGTGLSLQASYAKLHTRIITMDTDDATLANVDYTLLQDESYIELLRLMLQFPDVTTAAYKSNEPSLIMSYLVRLGGELAYLLEDDNGNDEDNRKGGAVPAEYVTRAAKPNEPESREAVLAQAVLFKHVEQVMSNGLRLLGIAPMAG